MPHFEVIVPMLYQTKRVDAFLTSFLEGQFSRNVIKTAIVKGDVRLNGKPARPRDPVKEGDKIEGELAEAKSMDLTPESFPIDIIYEDESLLVVNKPIGLVVHPGAGNKTGTLVHALIGRGKSLSNLSGLERPGIVHRLDKDTSGLLVVAKNNKTHRMLQSQFADRSLSRTYTALVHGVVEFDAGHINKSMARDPHVRTKMAISRKETALEAETHYRVLQRFHRATLLEVKLKTGRTHQIRVHLEDLGHPVVGDVVYGRKSDQSRRLGLHASRLEFIHPETGKLMKFECELPEDLKALIEAARILKKP